MRKIFCFVFLLLALSGCIAKSQSVDENSKNISKNSDNISKVADLVAHYHKDDSTESIKKEIKAVAEEVFESSLKDKSAINAETVKEVGDGVKSLTAMAGIPYGGIVMDLVVAAFTFFGSKKVVKTRKESIEKRDAENKNWVKYLASLSPEEAEKAIEINGV